MGKKRRSRGVRNWCGGEFSSRYRGVSWSKSKGKWQVTVRLGGRLYHFGYHAEEERQARLYDALAVRMHKGDAVLNFDGRAPDDLLEDDICRMLRKKRLRP